MSQYSQLQPYGPTSAAAPRASSQRCPEVVARVASRSARRRTRLQRHRARIFSRPKLGTAKRQSVDDCADVLRLRALALNGVIDDDLDLHRSENRTATAYADTKALTSPPSRRLDVVPFARAGQPRVPACVPVVCALSLGAHASNGRRGHADHRAIPALEHAADERAAGRDARRVGVISSSSV